MLIYPFGNGFCAGHPSGQVNPSASGQPTKSTTLENVVPPVQLGARDRVMVPLTGNCGAPGCPVVGEVHRGVQDAPAAWANSIMANSRTKTFLIFGYPSSH